MRLSKLHKTFTTRHAGILTTAALNILNYTFVVMPHTAGPESNTQSNTYWH